MNQRSPGARPHGARALPCTSESTPADAAGAISFGRRASILAQEQPHRPAIIFASGVDELVITRAQFNSRSNQLARLLASLGLGQGSLIAIALPNCPEHLLATLAGWKLGACVLPLSPLAPRWERDQVLEAARPLLLIAESSDAPPGTEALTRTDLQAMDRFPDQDLPDTVPCPGRAIPSGGSTGRPKVIVDPNPLVAVPGRPIGERGLRSGLRPEQTQLVTTRLYHAMPFNWTHAGLFDGHTVVLMERFDPRHALELMERHHVNWMQLVPIVMKRLAEAAETHPVDLSTLDALLHAGAPCPPWLKRWWIDRLGPEKVWEYYGSAENVGLTMIRGDEWLLHPGSVGKPVGCDLKILSDELAPLAPGEVGEIFTRQHSPGPTYHYLGSPPAKAGPDGFVSVGDLGWIDSAGYLFIADRRTDMIITGGANVYPAEVEAALSEHPAVGDLAIVPVPDDIWGTRVHAVIEPKDPQNPPSAEALDRFARDRLSPYKVPRSYEFVRTLPRDPSGKVRRSALRARSDRS